MQGLLSLRFFKHDESNTQRKVVVVNSVVLETVCSRTVRVVDVDGVDVDEDVNDVTSTTSST